MVGVKPSKSFIVQVLILPLGCLHKPTAMRLCVMVTVVSYDRNLRLSQLLLLNTA